MDMNTIVHVGDVVENEHQSVSQSNFRAFFPHYLGAWNRLISRKVVAKNVLATIPKCNMGYNQYTVPNVL